MFQIYLKSIQLFVLIESILNKSQWSSFYLDFQYISTKSSAHFEHKAPEGEGHSDTNLDPEYNTHSAQFLASCIVSQGFYLVYVGRFIMPVVNHPRLAGLYVNYTTSNRQRRRTIISQYIDLA